MSDTAEQALAEALADQYHYDSGEMFAARLDATDIRAILAEQGWVLVPASTEMSNGTGTMRREMEQHYREQADVMRPVVDAAVAWAEAHDAVGQHGRKMRATEVLLEAVAQLTAKGGES